MSILSDPCCIAFIALVSVFLIAAVVRWLRERREHGRRLHSQSPAPINLFSLPKP